MTLLLGVSLPVVGLSTFGVSVVHAAGTPIFTEAFKNNSVPDSHWVIGGSNFLPCMTASGNTTVTPIKSCGGTVDAAGTGALRLTDSGNSESGYVLYNSPLPATAGLDIVFDSYQYSGTGADGIAFFLTDGQFQLLQPGTSGGYLGYAGGNHGIGNGNGVAHGLFGVGLDAYGNFTNFENSPSQGGGNCSNAHVPTFAPNSVVLRGPGDADKVNYCYLAGAAAPSTLHVDAATDRTHSGANDVVRTVHIVVDPSSNVAPKVTVSINGTQVLQAAEPVMSSTVKFGWTASTGGANNIHELQNLTVSTINALNPSLSVTNTVNNGGTFLSGGGAAGDAAYTITNSGGANFETQPFTLTVPVPAGLGLTGTSVSDANMSCAATTATQLSCTYTPTGYGFAPAQSVTAHLLFSPLANYSHKDLLLTGSVSSPNGGSPTANQTLQVNPVALPNAITTDANVPGTGAQSAHGTAPFTWATGAAANPALISTETTDASGNLTVTPAAGVSGMTTVPLSVQDPSGAPSAIANVSVTVRPTVQPVTGSGTGPAPVYANIPAPVGTGPFVYAFASTPDAVTQGSVQFVPGVPEQIKFTPVQGFSGALPTFTYRVTDAAVVASSTATVDLTVGKPAPPAVAPVSGTIDANTTFTATVPAPTGTPPYTYSIATPPSAGVETISPAGVVSFTPPANASGIYNSYYQAQDQYGQPSSNGQIQVTVRPVVANFGGSTAGVSTLTLTAPAPAGSGPFTWSATPPQAHGPLTMDIASGQVVFTATAGYVGTFSFPYSVSDGVGTSAFAKTVTITVTVPPAPVAVAFASTQDADSVVSAQLPAPTGTGPFTYSVVAPPGPGSLVLQPNGHITYTPAAGTSGIVTFTYRVTDAYGSNSPPVTVTLNFRPVAPDVSTSTVGPQPVTVTGGPVDGTGPFTYTLVQPPAAQGSATVNQANGAITFTPTLGFSGPAQFSYTVTGAGPTTSAPAANVFVSVTKPAAPAASPLTGSTVSGGSTVVTATSSGTGPFTYAIAGAPGQGSASLTAPDQLHYTSTAPFSGTDTFTYTSTDAYGTTSAPATVTITVYPIAATPVNGSSTGPSPVIATPGAPTGSGPFTYNLVSASLPPLSQGTTTEDSTTGQITFTPVVGFSGMVNFSYTVTDTNSLTSAAGSVHFTIGNPTGPGVSPTSGTTTANTPVYITPPAATGTPPLTYQISTAPTLGSATISSAGVVHYIPNANVSGNDSLQYTATDPYAQTSVPATVTITVTPTETDGAAGPVVYPASANGTVPAPVGSGPFTYSLVTGTSAGVLVFPGDGTFTYTPALGGNPGDTFTFRARDSSSIDSNVATMTIAVNAPAAPTVVDQSATTPANVPVNADGTAGGTGTGPLTYYIDLPSDPSVAVTTIDVNTGQITFTPASNASGNTVATFYSRDRWGQVSPDANASVTVNPTSADGSTGPAVYPGTLLGNVPPAVGTGPFSVVLTGGVSNGTLNLNPDGSFSYSPALGFVGTDTFTWVVQDAALNTSVTYTESITVNAPAQPTEADASGTTNANAPLAVQLPAAVGAGGPFTYAMTGQCTAFGSLLLNANTGAGTFTPAAGMSGISCFMYTATDAYGQTTSPASSYALTVRPLAQNAAATDNAPGPVTLTPGAPTGTGVFTWALATTPSAAQGVAGIDSAIGAVTFTPTAGFSGNVSFTYTVTGADGVTSQPATISITVVKPAAPTVQDVSGMMMANTVIHVTTPGPTGVGPFSYSLTAATHGVATVAGSGTITYTPAHNFGGVETFTYRATDAYAQASNAGNVTITVLKPAAPAVADVSATTTVNVPVTLTPSSPTGSGPFTWAIGTPPAQGTVAIDANTGVMSYTPAAGASGTVVYTFVATDQYGTPSPPAMGTVHVHPAAGPKSIIVLAAAGPVTITLPTPSGTGPFTCTLVISSLPPASQGTATVNAANCTMTFTPATGFTGVVHFQYTATDASGLISIPATVSIDVLGAVIVSNTQPAPDTGTHLWKSALAGGSLTLVGLLILVLGIRMRRRETGAPTAKAG